MAKRRTSSACLDGQQGAVIVLLAVIILPLALVLALFVDTALIMISKNQQENNAEYAAVAGLQAYVESTPSSIAQKKQIAIEVAEKIAKRNLLVGRPGTPQVNNGELQQQVAGMIRFGNRDASTGAFTEVPLDVACNSVSVELHTRPTTAIMMVFARVLGVQDLNLNASAKAFYDAASGPPSKPQYYLVGNGSGQST